MGPRDLDVNSDVRGLDKYNEVGNLKSEFNH